MKIVSVDFQMGGDGRVALYLNGKKIKEGDYYHDKIDEFIQGFVFALETLKIEHTFKSIVAIEENSVAWVYMKISMKSLLIYRSLINLINSKTN